MPLRIKSDNKAVFANGEWILLLVLLIEATFFSAIAPHFFTLANLMEILRFSIELGLLAVALTPVLIVGGIDLSVGSTLGMTAVIFGLVWQQVHLSIPLAVTVALLVGLASGALNALMIAGLRLPALIVTLGTYSLYRGIAEGITHGAVSYTGYPKAFLLLGQGYLWNTIPMQLPLFFLVVVAYVVLVHQSVIGRAFYAIGFNAEGARYAGIPVRRRLALVYVLSGIVASLAAVIFVAHIGLAKSDLGTG
jgi:rhamnose transport system permease protein